MTKINSIESFSFTIGGYDADNFSMRALYNILNYDATSYSHKTELSKNKRYSDEIMQELITKFNEIQILNWKNSYVSDACDGIQWELKINYDHSKVKKINGSNLYPDIKEDSEELSPVFQSFLKALSEFIEEPDFFDVKYFEKNKSDI